MYKLQWNLKNDLKSFGLNPDEWIIRRLSGKKYKIASTGDLPFFFLGKVRRTDELPQWQELKLISL